MDENLKSLTPEEREKLLTTLEARFVKNMQRHPGLLWSDVQTRLNQQPLKLWALSEMERTGGEPDVVAHEAGEYVFFDCSPESPAGRRNACYDRAALDARKEFKPENSAVEWAASMGFEILTEEQYRQLQSLGKFDTKTSSWVITPAPIRRLGGATFMDRRYDHVFFYHNGADSYYAARGFRGVLRV
jgi:hypothetical protein